MVNNCTGKAEGYCNIAVHQHCFGCSNLAQPAFEFDRHEVSVRCISWFSITVHLWKFPFCQSMSSAMPTNVASSSSRTSNRQRVVRLSRKILGACLRWCRKQSAMQGGLSRTAARCPIRTPPECSEK